MKDYTLSQKEKHFLKVKSSWIKKDDEKVDLGRVSSLEEFFSKVPEETWEEIDKNTTEVCVDCGEVYQSTWDYHGKVPVCSRCGKVLSSIPTDSITEFKNWQITYSHRTK